ncbi:MAG: polyketide cyclase [Bacteroidota bacterium]
MKNILRDRSFRLSIILTLIFLCTGIAFLFLGLADYSWILFLLLPFLLGIAIGVLPNRKWVMYGGILTAVVFLVFLLLAGLSGFICVVMSFPIIASLIFLGAIVTHLVERYKQIKSKDTLPVLLFPLLVFMIAAPAERFLKEEKKQLIEVRTEQVFNYSPEEVYDAIKSVDTLIADKPFLMNFDLPVPVKCVLSKEEVGGIRTCYFSGGNLSRGDFGGGTITEKITALERGKLLKMDVVDYNLIGRKWLGFKEAIYYFDKIGNGQCKLTRVTTYTSELTPRFYWEPLEKIGIRQEHDYVFANLTNDLKKKTGR